MKRNFTRLAFSDSVKKEQQNYGTRESYARMETAEDRYQLTEWETGFILSRDSFLAHAASAVPADVTTAIREGNPAPEAKLSALNTFTTVMVTKRGLPDRADVDAFLSAGYTEHHILEIILAIAVKTISNYTNHTFHTEVDEVFAKHQWTDASS